MHPDVVVLVDAHRVRERPRVQAFADLANELAVRAELEELRRGRRVGRPGRAVGSREDEDVPLRVERDASASPKFRSGGSLKKFGTESNGISGGGCCANDVAPSSTNSMAMKRFTDSSYFGPDEAASTTTTPHGR